MESEIKDVYGDILTPCENTDKTTIVCHQTNCCGVMGAGLAKQIKTRFPYVFGQYAAYCEKYGPSCLGTVLYTRKTDCGYIIANVFGQNRYGKTGRFTDYGALEKAFNNIVRLYSRSSCVVRIPYKMGCGLGGGDWSVVKPLIEKCFKDTTVQVEIWHF